MDEQEWQREGEPMEHASLSAQLEELHAMSFGWAMNCCASHPVDAEDVLQTAYQKILAGRARFDGRSAFKTWLFAVIRNTAADLRRRNWVREIRLAGFGQEHAHDFQPADRGASLEKDERLRAFRDALQQLPWRQREVLHLVFYQDLTVEAAAGVMGVSIGSARTHYERGKRRLGQWAKTAPLFK